MAGGIRDLEALFHSDHFFLGNVMLIKKSVNYIDHLDKFLVITMKFCSIKKKKGKRNPVFLVLLVHCTKYCPCYWKIMLKYSV